MRISDIARRVGLRPSAIRYYESLGLLPPPPRLGGARIYDAEVLDRLALIQFGARSGFTLREVGLLFNPHTPRASRRQLAQGRIRRLRQQRRRLAVQERLLRAARLCRCGSLSVSLRRLRRIGAITAERAGNGCGS